MTKQTSMPERAADWLEFIRNKVGDSNKKYYEKYYNLAVKLYDEFKTYDDVYNNISRYDAMRLFEHHPQLIDKEGLGTDKFNALFHLYDSAKETI